MKKNEFRRKDVQLVGGLLVLFDCTGVIRAPEHAKEPTTALGHFFGLRHEWLTLRHFAISRFYCGLVVLCAYWPTATQLMANFYAAATVLQPTASARASRRNSCSAKRIVRLRQDIKLAMKSPFVSNFVNFCSANNLDDGIQTWWQKKCKCTEEMNQNHISRRWNDDRCHETVLVMKMNMRWRTDTPTKVDIN